MFENTTGFGNSAFGVISRLETANAEQVKAIAQTQQELRVQGALMQKISARLDAGAGVPSLEDDQGQ